MRMRFKPYAAGELEACPFYVAEPQALRGRWHDAFVRPDAPLMLELGCGKGGFIAQLAVQNPTNNYLGIDLTNKVLVLAKRKVESAFFAANLPADNVKVLTHDIERITSMLAAGDTVTRIYINFCNPWNKKCNQEKHRLTHTRQLLQYRNFLSDEGEIYFKCDDERLFEDSLRYFDEADFKINWITRDLHADEPTWNLRTEHEDMYAREGIKIKALIAVKA